MSFKRVRSLPNFPSPKELSAPQDQHHHLHQHQHHHYRRHRRAGAGAAGGEDAAADEEDQQLEPPMEVDGGGGPVRMNSNKRSHFRSGPRPPQVCSFWREGRCNRDPCNFLHTEDPSAIALSNSNGKRSSVALADDRLDMTAAGSGRRNVWARLRGSKAGKPSGGGRPRDKPCIYFLRGNCMKGSQCSFLHSHSTTTDISYMTQLVGHEKAVRAIALPVGANKLYTGGQDQTIRVWDCGTGECTTVVAMGGDVGCLLTEAGWLFVGLPDEVKALNLQTNTEQRLDGPKGQVHALAVGHDMLLAGAQDGSILAWKYNSSVNLFQPVASLWGHSGAVVTLEAADGKLYSGALDKTIKVWDLNTGECLQTLQGHTNVVMGLLCWNQFLLSGSLDGTIKVWAPTQSGSLELQYTFPKDAGTNDSLDGVLAFCGFVDQQNKDILMCSFNDNTVHLLELPSFTERGVMFSKDEVRALQVGPGGLVFSGDSSGGVKVWKWSP